MKKPVDITLGDGHMQKATDHGTVCLRLKSGSLQRRCRLDDVLYVPELTYNLECVSKATEKGMSFKFNNDGCILKDNKVRRTIKTYP